MRNNGFSLLSVLATACLVSIVGLSVTKLMINATNGASAVEIKLTHTQLAARLAGYAFSPQALYATYTRSPEANPFHRCLAKDPSFSVCIHNHAYGFNLLDHSTAPGPIVGTDRDPVYYDVWGRTCNTPDRNCVFQAHVSFVAKCNAPDLTCDQAEGIDITFVLEPIPGNTEASLSGRGLASTTIGKRIVKTGFVSTREILNAKPPGDVRVDPILSCVWYVSPRTGTETTVPSPFDGVECADHIADYFDHCYCPENKRLQGIDRCSFGPDAMMRCLCC